MLSSKYSFWGNSVDAVDSHRRELQHSWGWFLAFGTLTSLIGLFAFVESFIATTAFVIVLGASFMAA
ncbi:hypothetical protein, partial [Glaesserella parasuis]|uniref:hypothetical protein n=1 Tax=Glaesserella parasuis TaxID=738 RepID=UPI003F2D5C2D